MLTFTQKINTYITWILKKIIEFHLLNWIKRIFQALKFIHNNKHYVAQVVGTWVLNYLVKDWLIMVGVYGKYMLDKSP